jgi:prophage maintenance system killer protein
LATAVFLRVDGLDLALDDDEAFELTMSAAAGQLNADDIDKRLRTSPARR